MFFKQSALHILKSLGLSSEEIKNLLENLFNINQWHNFGDDEHKVRVHIKKLKSRKYFALIDCESLCGIEDKSLYLRQAIEHAMSLKGVPVPFEDIAVGGLASDAGRLAIFSWLQGSTPPAVHEYSVFKLPSESKITIDDPRSSLLGGQEKFQSRYNNEVCCFASAAVIFTGYMAYKNNAKLKNSNELLSSIYANNHLRSIIRDLESKVGSSDEIKEEIIDKFICTLRDYFNPPLISLTSPQYGYR